MTFELFGYTVNIIGIILGFASFLIIMFSRYSCIAGEYHFTKKLWIVFLIVGILAVLISFLLTNIIVSTIVAIIGFNYLWGINEIIEQENRVNKGWFPKNPKRR
ncbi:MAG: DUF4491 domain-containing protein [Bacteroidetes bacterium HGW-Bacteroidetes-17]|jgi:hypothetical protein|nr:MAG: DUF4491 domain-containing protein [Bacteroidetes bacterium HGW-Bacteroidetes-17]